MRIRISYLCHCVAIFWLLGVSVFAENKVASSVKLDADRPMKVWVTFRDKGFTTPDALEAALDEYWAQLPERVRQRRTTRASTKQPTVTDLPVAARYVEAVRKTGAKVNVQSRWLNSVSVEATPDQIRQIAALPFVQTVDRVHTFTDTFEPPNTDSPSSSSHAPAAPRQVGYGLAEAQITQIQADFVHGQGFTGSGVIIGVLDSGFDLEHATFEDIDVLAQRDFVHGDDNTMDEVGQDDPQQDDHGTITLGTLAGNSPGQFMGVAYDASYLLGKTERVWENGRVFEREIEEDWWVEGIEWLEASGADLVSTSLGYSQWYRFEDMNGQTSKITIAANLAVEKGLPVVVSAGNLGGLPMGDGLGLPGRINAPADGFDVIAVGAVGADGRSAAFSSHGPTFDGRIKPDVMALGVDTASVRPGTLDRFSDRFRGTSVSAPLVAGLVGLLIQAFPLATPEDIASVLRSTGTRADAPDNIFGYGITQGRTAFLALLDQFGHTGPPNPVAVEPDAKSLPTAWGHLKVAELSQNFPNPFNAETWIPFRLMQPGQAKIILYDWRGQIVNTLQLGFLPTGDYSPKPRAAYWNGRTQTGERVASGSYFYVLEVSGQRYVRKLVVLE